MVESMRWARKIGGLLAGQNGKGKKEIKIENDFWAAENWKFDSNVFYLKILQNICKWDLVLSILSYRTKMVRNKIKWKSYD
jgi:hypothetical protein